MNNPMTYKAAGVDIDEANLAVGRMRDVIRSTYTPAVLSDVGAFGGLFKATFEGYNDPVLVSSIDGVGTKTKIAQVMARYDTIGRDLVNHSINDILVQGARPLFFLDYFGTGQLDATIASQIVTSIAEACKESGCVLLGGETAQMPDVYHGADFDLVGTIVGIVDREKMLPTTQVMPGCAVIGIASSGLHTNGYTLARRVLFDMAKLNPGSYVPELNSTVGDALMAVHRSYAPDILPLLDEFPIAALAHITGGGFYDNIPRVIPSDCRVAIERRSWEVPPIYRLIQESGQVPDYDMFHTFNMGIGMVLICGRDIAATVVERLNAQVTQAAIIGEVSRGAHDVQLV
jgi:phosphoribosylformylglycinamidine cyclo-ligase